MSEYAAIPARELKSTITDGRELALIDVREQGVFGRGHLLFATCIPLSRLELRIRDLVPRRDVRMVLVDGGDGEALARTAAGRLAALGYTGIRLLDGGTAGWQAAGYELFSGVGVPSKAFGEFVEHTYDTPRLSAADLKARVDVGEDIVILDSRPYDEYRRMSIPGGIDAPGAELVHRVHDVAPEPHTTVVVNCAGRTRSIIGAQSLINAGIPNRVMALENGTMGWHLAGFEVARGAIDVAPPPSPGGLAKANACAARVAARFGVETIDRATLRDWQADAARSLFVLDVRTPEEFAAGHLPGARHAPGGQLVQGTDEYVGIRNARLVLVDDNGVRATMTASWLIQMGWPEVRVLAGGIGADGSETGPRLADRPAPPAAEPIAASALAVALAGAAPPLVVDLDTSLAYRDGHIPGAWWGVRSRLERDIEALPDGNEIVVTSQDGAIAGFAAPEIAALRPGARVRVLAGGTAAWRAGERPLEAGTERLLGPHDDVQYRPYDNAGGVEAAMRAYLSWETALVDQVARDGDARFRRFAEP
jgi:rhodanese-related sulfurtransferase